MRIKDVRIDDVWSGKNWRAISEFEADLVDIEIEECSSWSPEDTVVYSALAVARTGDVRPLLLIREVGTYEWWGDTVEYVGGAWRSLEMRDASEEAWEEYVANPLDDDPSFMGEYSHDKQRAGFARWRDHLRRGR